MKTLLCLRENAVCKNIQYYSDLNLVRAGFTKKKVFMYYVYNRVIFKKMIYI